MESVANSTNRSVFGNVTTGTVTETRDDLESSEDEQPDTVLGLVLCFTSNDLLG